MSRTGRGSVDRPGVEVTNETNMAERQNSTRVQAPNIQRLPLFSAPAHLQPAGRTKSTKSTTGGRANDELPIKLTRGISDSVEKKVNIFRPKVTLSVGTWNVRTIMNDYAVKLLVHELARYNCDIVGIAETHRLGVEELEEGGYKIIASGKAEGNHRSGVALVLSRVAQSALIGYNPISDRILMARFHAFVGEMVVLQVYAPTAEAEDAVIDEFYHALQSAMKEISHKSCVVVMGDFNAKIGSAECGAKGVSGKFGYGSKNARGEQLLSFCGLNNLVVATTLFKQSRENRSWTWESPDKRTHNRIDYIMVSRKFRGSIMNARAFPSADVGSDHQLVIANLKMRLKRRVQAQKTQRMDVGRLADPLVRTAYEITVGGRFKALMEEEVGVGVNDTWNTIKSVFQEATHDLLGVARPHKTKNWLSDDTRQLADERRKWKPKRRETSQNAKHYNYLCREVKRRGKADKESYLNEICRKVEETSSQNKSRAVYQSIKLICGKKNSQIKTIKDKSGKVLTDPEHIKSRWREHFDQLYNVINTADSSVLQELPKSADANSEETPKLLREEVEMAVKGMKAGKSPGMDNITADEMKAAGDLGIDVLFKLCSKIWDAEEIPSDWSRSIIVPIFKKKDKTVCDNYRGISLLCHSEKMFASLILQRIRKKTDEILSESQAGFRRGRSTIDQLFSLRMLAEKYKEFSKHLYLCFIDYQKAFDSIWREGLWHVMEHLGYEGKIIRLLKALYKETFSTVRVDGEFTDWFQTVVGVLQRCVLSPLLFCVFLKVVAAQALGVEEEGVVVSGSRISNLKFADDIALL